MIRAIGGLLAAAALAAGSPAAAEAPDPTDAHRWHMPRRGARKLAQDVAGPEHAEWDRLGHLVNAGKEKLGDWGIRFDVDLDFFDQYASRVISGQQNLGTFSWRILGDWKLLDFTSSEHVSAIGKGFA